MTKSLDIIAQLQAAVLQALLAPLTNIQTALTTIAANKDDILIVQQQIAVIQGQFATVIAEAPALLPTLQGELIGDGATQVNDLLAEVIAEINSQIAPAGSSAASTASAG